MLAESNKSMSLVMLQQQQQTKKHCISYHFSK